MSFAEWKEKQRGHRPTRDELGFIADFCDLCGALPGDRHAAAALHPDGTYTPLEVCGDCLQYIANGELPQGETE